MQPHPLASQVTPERVAAWVTAPELEPAPVRILVLGRESQAVLERPVNGHGGWQSLLRRLQAGRRGAVLTVATRDLEMLMRYTQGRRVGGFQRRCRAILIDGVLTDIINEGRRLVIVPRGIDGR
jgi:hypothetical protein